MKLLGKAIQEVYHSEKNKKIALKVLTMTAIVKVKYHQLQTTSSVRHGTYSYQVTSTSVQQFTRFSVDSLTDRQTDRRQKQYLFTACAQVVIQNET